MKTQKIIRILIADDHAIVRMGLTSLISAQKDMEVVGEAENGLMAVSETCRLSPDVVILDLMMPQMDGSTATAEIRRLAPESKVVILTSFVTSDSIAHALDNGASGVVMKNSPNADLLDTIRRATAGEQSIPPAIAKLLREDPPVQEMTARQLEILSLMAEGLTNSDISMALDICEQRVKEHVISILAKIGAANRTEAVAIAFKKHLLNS